MKELWKEVSRLHSIRKGEEEIDWVSYRSLQLQDPKSPAVMEGQEESLPMKLGSGNSNHYES